MNIGETNEKKLAAFYASDTFAALSKLVSYKIQCSKNDRTIKETMEKTALNIAKQDGAEEALISLLQDVERYYKKLNK